MPDRQQDFGMGSSSASETKVSGSEGSGGIINACFIQVLKKSFQFSGRARRREFWYFMLFYVVGYFIVTLLLPSPAPTLYWLLMFMPNLAVTVRRMHDTGHSGVLAFINSAAAIAMRTIGIETLFESFLSFTWIAALGAIIITVTTAMLIFIFVVGDSQIGTNQYGPSPKNP